MLISTFVFLSLNSTNVALYDSQLTITVIYLVAPCKQHI